MSGWYFGGSKNESKASIKINKDRQSIDFEHSKNENPSHTFSGSFIQTSLAPNTSKEEINIEENKYKKVIKEKGKKLGHKRIIQAHLKKDEDSSKKRVRPVLTVVLFCIGLLFLAGAVLTFGSTSPVYFLLGVYGLLLMLISMIMALIYKKRIDENSDSKNKKWLYRVIIYLSIVILALLMVAIPEINKHP
ncbi:MAG: hypothetical protein SFY56_05710 [Bacteroidota bacterium]|nr:hypothetical protein [Bacteroidota bacterium]